LADNGIKGSGGKSSLLDFRDVLRYRKVAAKLIIASRVLLALAFIVAVLSFAAAGMAWWVKDVARYVAAIAFLFCLYLVWEADVLEKGLKNRNVAVLSCGRRIKAVISLGVIAAVMMPMLVLDVSAWSARGKDLAHFRQAVRHADYDWIAACLYDSDTERRFLIAEQVADNPKLLRSSDEVLSAMLSGGNYQFLSLRQLREALEIFLRHATSMILSVDYVQDSDMYIRGRKSIIIYRDKVRWPAAHNDFSDHNWDKQRLFNAVSDTAAVVVVSESYKRIGEYHGTTSCGSVTGKQVLWDVDVFDKQAKVITAQAHFAGERPLSVQLPEGSTGTFKAAAPVRKFREWLASLECRD